VNAYYHVYDYDIQTTLYKTVRRTERRKVCVNLTGIIVWFSFDIMMSCSLPVPFLLSFTASLTDSCCIQLRLYSRVIAWSNCFHATVNSESICWRNWSLHWRTCAEWLRATMHLSA